MAEISLSIAQLFNQAFGYIPESFEKDMEVYFGEASRKLPTRKETNDIGTSPYYDTDKQGREYYMPVTLGELKLEHPVISCSIQKHIIETPLVERPGTVKELINIEDWVFTIRGLIISPDNEYPEAAVQDLVKLFERNEPVTMGNAISDLLLIRGNNQDKVVIKSLRLPEVKGVRNVRAYEMELVSDTEFDLYEIE